MKIREATIDDVPTLKMFLQGIVEAERPMDACLQPEHIEYYDPADFINNSDSMLLVAEKSGALVACGAGSIKASKHYYVHDKHLYLAMMYVLPEYRGQGINQKILEGLIEWGRQNNVTYCKLTVYPQNTGAIKAYEKLGFESVLLEMRLRPET